VGESEVKELDDRIRNIEVRMAMVEQRQDTTSQDVKEIKNTLTWLNRIALGGLIAGVLNLVLKVGA
jgi:chaperonin cofactor prefoldin